MVAATRLRIKRVYEPGSRNDGARILIDRVWPRGISKNAAALTSWLKDVAPSTKLRNPVRWAEFRRRYHKELDANRPAIRACVNCCENVGSRFSMVPVMRSTTKPSRSRTISGGTMEDALAIALHRSVRTAEERTGCISPRPAAKAELPS